MLGQQIGHLLGEDFTQQGFQLAVGALNLLCLQPAQGVEVGQQIDLNRIAGVPERGNLQDRRPAQTTVGEQDIFAKALVVAAHQAIHRRARQLGADLFELIGDGERHQACAGWQQGVAELFGDLIAEACGAQGRDRQPAGGDHQRLAVNRPQRCIEAVAVVGFFDLFD